MNFFLEYKQYSVSNQLSTAFQSPKRHSAPVRLKFHTRTLVDNRFNIDSSYVIFYRSQAYFLNDGHISEGMTVP